jgi:SAM-dependent methyltransferase
MGAAEGREGSTDGPVRSGVGAALTVGVTGTPEYHAEELRIALSADHPAKILPPVAPSHRRVLDVGCGAGQTLIAAVLGDGRECVGVDVDPSALALGRTYSTELRLACASGEALPFRSASFDLVICRVAMPYMHVATAIAEMGRVLRTGGEIWLVLHPVQMAVAWLWRSLRQGRLRAAAFRCFVIANGFVLHVTGRQLAAPVGRNRWETFQTRRSISRALRRAGFTEVRTERGRHFVASAVRR